MTLYDIATILPDTVNVEVYQGGQQISVYDGKNSIEKDLMDSEIIEIYPVDNAVLTVTVRDA